MGSTTPVHKPAPKNFTSTSAGKSNTTSGPKGGSASSQSKSGGTQAGATGKSGGGLSAGAKTGPGSSSSAFKTGNIPIPFADTLGLKTKSFNLSGAHATKDGNTTSGYGISFNDKDGKQVSGGSMGGTYKSDEKGNPLTDDKGNIQKSDKGKFESGGNGNFKVSAHGNKPADKATASVGKDSVDAGVKSGDKKAQAKASNKDGEVKTGTGTTDGKSLSKENAAVGKDGKASSSSLVKDSKGNGAKTTAESKDGSTATAAKLNTSKNGNNQSVDAKTGAAAKGKDVKLTSQAEGKAANSKNTDSAKAKQEGKVSTDNGSANLNGGVSAKAGKDGAKSGTTGNAKATGNNAKGNINNETAAKHKDAKTGKTYENTSKGSAKAETKEGKGPKAPPAPLAKTGGETSKGTPAPLPKTGGETAKLPAVKPPTKESSGIGINGANTSSEAGKGTKGNGFAKGSATNKFSAAKPADKDSSTSSSFNGSSTSKVKNSKGNVLKTASDKAKTSSSSDAGGKSGVGGRLGSGVSDKKSIAGHDTAALVNGKNGSATSHQSAKASGNGSVNVSGNTLAKNAKGSYDSKGTGYVRGLGKNLDGSMKTNTSASHTNSDGTTYRNKSSASELAKTRGNGNQDININDPATSKASAKGASGRAWGDIKAKNDRNEDPLAKFSGSSVSEKLNAKGQVLQKAAVDGKATGQTDLAGSARAKGDVSSRLDKDGAGVSAKLGANTRGKSNTDAWLSAGAKTGPGGSINAKGLEAKAKNMAGKPLEAKTGGRIYTAGAKGNAFLNGGDRINTPKGTWTNRVQEKATGKDAKVSGNGSLSYNPKTGAFKDRSSGSARGGSGSSSRGITSFKPPGRSGNPFTRTSFSSNKGDGVTRHNAGIERGSDGQMRYNGLPLNFRDGSFFLGNDLVGRRDPLYPILRNLTGYGD